MIRTLLSLICFSLLASLANAQYKRTSLPIGHDGANSTVHVFLFQHQRFQLRFIDQTSIKSPAHKNLNAAMVLNGCIAGANGGIFTDSGKPRGLLRINSKTIAKLDKSNTANGVLICTGKETKIIKVGEYQESLCRHAMQAGPFLVKDSAAQLHKGDTTFQRRSFIATDNRGNWVIGYTPPTTLEALSNALAIPNAIPGLKPTHALLLDSGNNCGFWVKRETSHPFYLKEINTVRSFIGVVRK